MLWLRNKIFFFYALIFLGPVKHLSTVRVAHTLAACLHAKIKILLKLSTTTDYHQIY